MSLLRSAAWSAGRFLSQNGGIFSDAIYNAARIYEKTYVNHDYNMRRNGEFHILGLIANLHPSVVLDVGANKGEYTLACLEAYPHAQIHSFEIAPPTFEKLRANVSSKRARLNNIGLSNFSGSFELSYNPDDDGSSSLIAGSQVHSGGWITLSVDAMAGDEYLRQNNIPSVDFMKIDVEGAEHMVLEGFSKSFKAGLISAVQFEFGMVNIYSKFLLKDFWDFFEKNDFVVGPVMPRGVNFRDYDTRDENFQGPPNFFAAHRSRKDIIEVVGLRRGKTSAT